MNNRQLAMGPPTPRLAPPLKPQRHAGGGAMGKKAEKNLKGIDKQPDRLLLGGIIIGNGFCYRYIISLVVSKNWSTNNWLTKTKRYNF